MLTKVLSAGAVSLVLTALLTSAVTAAPVKNPTSQNIEYVALGDSLTVGYEPGYTADSAPYGFVERLYEQALYHGMTEVKNYGINGLTTSGLKKYIAAIAEDLTITAGEIQPELSGDLADKRAGQTAEVKKELQSATLITVTIGGNDFLNLLETIGYDFNRIDTIAAEVPAILDNYKRDIVEILRMLRTLNPTAEIVLSDQYQPLPEFVNKDAYAELSVVTDLFALTMEEVAASQTTGPKPVIVPVGKAFEGREGEFTHIVMNRDIHPNQSGYEAMAKAFAETIWGKYNTLTDPAKPAVVAAGKEIVSPYKPIVVNGTTSVSIKEITDALGAKTRWDAASKSTVVTYGGKVVKLKGGAKTMIVNGKTVAVTSPVRFVQGKTYVPLRLLTEGLGFKLYFSGKSQTIYINK
ncbi:hypothetical protein SY83_12765 [Paenibacillus swuensis]|uniref:Copper amine oxidase n=1 Tax=Paenibacillus swuensis TaxID=1178515 RepID=A0A172TIY3_9BACL|nr:stalk domain-containing protein [Paenibacillus swuensis]ANE47001.1 hypothetical protein SY83_12765 [Paenibacillus swuensis]